MDNLNVEAAYFIHYEGDRLLDLSIVMDTLGAYHAMPDSWILRTRNKQLDVWGKFQEFVDNNSTLFMIQVFPGSLAYWLPKSFTRDPLKEFLVGLDPYILEK
jgi:hypothetical protein